MKLVGLNLGHNKNIHKLDVSGHKCPIPVLRLRRTLEKLKCGDYVQVKATDPMTLIDIPNFCRESGHNFIRKTEQEDYILYLVEKGSLSLSSKLETKNYNESE